MPTYIAESVAETTTQIYTRLHRLARSNSGNEIDKAGEWARTIGIYPNNAPKLVHIVCDLVYNEISPDLAAQSKGAS